MIRFVAQWLVPIALAVFAVVDCLLTPRPFVRALPKPLWVLLILVPYVGALLWIFTGRAATPQDLNRSQRRRASDTLPAADGLGGLDDLEGLEGLGSLPERPRRRRRARAPRPLAAELGTPMLPPDDDPEFLRRLGEQMRKDRPEG